MEGETKLNQTKINQTKINRTKINRGRNPTNSVIRSRDIPRAAEAIRPAALITHAQYFWRMAIHQAGGNSSMQKHREIPSFLTFYILFNEVFCAGGLSRAYFIYRISLTQV